MAVAINPSTMDDETEPANDDREDVPLGTFLSQAFEDVDVEVDPVQDVRDVRERE